MIDPRDSRIVRRAWASTPEKVRSLIRRTPLTGRRPSIVEELPTELTAQGSRRQLDFPPGHSREDLFDMLATVSIDQAPPAELQAYLDEDFERFVITWRLVAALEGRALEIGANPYFTTVLLREFTPLDLTLTNSFDPAATGRAAQQVSYRPVGEEHNSDVLLEYHQLNVEAGAFPFAEGDFDVVLFCEVIEHLLNDPVRALLEIKRVLRPGGTLVLSTPNVARLENVARLVAGANLYDPYSGYGPYGRHNREYTRHELVRLLEFVGFDPVDHFTADVHPHGTAAFADPGALRPLVDGRLGDLGQYVFVTAVNARPPRSGRPAALFRSMAGTELVGWDEPASIDDLRPADGR